MEEVKYKINTGVKIGLVYFVFFLISYFIGHNPYSAASITSLGTIAAIVLLYLAVKNYRNLFTEGVFPFGEVFKTTISIAFFYASFTAIICYLFCSSFDNEVIERYKLEAIQAMGQMETLLNPSKEVKESFLKNIEQTTLFKLMFGDFQNKLIGSFMFGGIFGLMLKQSKSDLITTNLPKE